MPQEAGGLDERIAAAFAHCERGPALLVGMDTPQLTPELLSRVGHDGHDAWFGPAADGGFWALGLADPARAAALVRGVPVSTARTGATQRCRLVEAGFSVGDLPVLRDVDTAADVMDVAACCPSGSHFATTLAALARGGEPVSRAAGGSDPVIAERAARIAALRNPRTVAWPAHLPAQPGEPWTDDPYARALSTGRGRLFLRRLSPRARCIDHERC